MDVLELSVSTTDRRPYRFNDDNLTHVHRFILGARNSRSLCSVSSHKHLPGMRKIFAVDVASMR
jgi:hypothetical protein